MTPSFFSAMRLTVMMLVADGKVTSVEKKWHRKLCNSFDMSHEQTQVLREDLKQPLSKEKVESIFYQINLSDRVRLLNLLETAMSLEGNIPAQNLRYFDYIKCLTESRLLEDQHFARQTHLVQAQMELENLHWTQFEKAAVNYSESVRRSQSGFSRFPQFRVPFPSPLYKYYPEARPWIVLFFLGYFLFYAFVRCQH